MSEGINDGGPAFPCQPHDPQGAPCGPLEYGMSLRDWFAGMALQGLLTGQHSESSKHNMSGLPEECFGIADAMIAARNQNPKE